MQWINHKSWKKVNGNKNCSILKDSSYLNENTVWTIGNTMYYPGLNSEIKPSLTRVLPLMYQTCRPWWCWGCHDTPDLWHISYVTLFQQGGQIMPPHHYWHPQIFRPSYGPVHYNGVAMLQYFLSQLSLILCSHMIETYQLNNWRQCWLSQVWYEMQNVKMKFEWKTCSS